RGLGADLSFWTRCTLQVARCPKQGVCHEQRRVTCRPATCTVRGRAGEWSVRHVRRRVRLTLRLGRREPRARFGAAPAGDVPITVQRLPRLRGERDHLSRGGRARAY